MLLALILAAAGATGSSPALPRWHISTNVLSVPAGSLAADFTITDDDSVDERFEVAASSWSQRGGIDRRRPDVDGVLIFPRLLELVPGESERVRVGVLESDPGVESDYRVTVEQLFDPQQTKPGIHFLLAYDMPLFIAPQRVTIDARIASVAARGGQLVVRIRNDGDVHVFARSMTVQWLGGAETFRRPFYVLPRSAMAFAFSERRCGTGVVVVAADTQSHIAGLSATLGIPCAPRTAHGARPERRIVSLSINHVPAGDAVVVTDGTDLYVRARDLAWVPLPQRPATKRIGGDVYDSLASSGASYVYDPASLSLDLEYRVSGTHRLVVAVPTPERYRNGTSASIAYTGSFTGSAPVLSERATLAMPSGQISLGFANAKETIYRTDLDATLLEHGQDGEVIFGDQSLESGGALPVLPIFGTGLTSGTLVRTSGERAPFERISGHLRDPATIAIAVSGEEPIEVGVEPGEFAIDGVPIAARITAIDALTNLPVQVVAQPPLGDLIAPGWRDLNLALGAPRVCVYACAAYRGFAAGGALLVGDSLFLASGPHFEYLDGRTGAGYDAIVADPNRALQLSAGAGPLDGLLASYEERTGPLSFGLGYGTSGAPAYDQRGVLVAQRRTISETANAAFHGVRLQYQRRRSTALDDMRLYDIIEDVPLFHSALQLDLREQRTGIAPSLLSLGVLLPVVPSRSRDVTLLGTTIGAHQGRAAIVASQLDTPSGLQIAAGADGDLRASYVSDRIEVAASSERVLTVSGAVAFLHGVHFVRDTSGGYAVVAGQSGDLIRDGDGRIHAVGARGAAFPLAPSDRPERLAYVQRNVTIDGDAALSASSIYPEPNAGALIVITHRRLFAVIGTVAGRIWRDGTIVLGNGARSPIGSDGVFYFEELPPGTYRAWLLGTSRSCATVVVVPVSRERQIDLGSITCASVRLR